MANYCVMNVKKNGRSAVHGLQLEANRKPGDKREFDLSDIDPDKTKDNIWLRECAHWNSEITRQIKQAGLRERKDSIVLLTGVYTASPEWYETHTREEWLDYFRACLDFHDREYGHAFNAVVHLDEQTPHMQVASVPIIWDEKGAHLSAKIIIGNREDMSRRQDMFWSEVGRDRGLDRGEHRDPEAQAEVKAHTTKREWQIATQEARLEEAQAKEAEAQARAQALQEKADRIKSQELDALRERDKARAERDAEKVLSKAVKAVLSPAKTDVEILDRARERKTILGKVQPARVVIRERDLEQLKAQAQINAGITKAAKGLDVSIREMKEAAREANQNQIDRQAAADRAAQKKAVQDAKREADRERKRAEAAERQLREAQEKIQRLEEQLAMEQENQRDMLRILSYYPDAWKEMKEKTQRIRDMEKLYQVRETDKAWRNSFGRLFVKVKGEEIGIRTFLRTYLEECRSLGAKPNRDMAEHMDRIMARDREERGLGR